MNRENLARILLIPAVVAVGYFAPTLLGPIAGLVVGIIIGILAAIGIAFARSRAEQRRSRTSIEKDNQ